MDSASVTPEKHSAQTPDDIVKFAERVLENEISGLMALRRSVDDNFVKAVETIDRMKQGRGQGRLIVAGIGKSGHIARKIVATLASTGTPSFFVHPGEASHGDMGMITQNDIVLLLSNSGENTELSDLIHYTRRFDITLIALTGNPESSLARYADICICLPKVPEACPNGLAPTTSTTMMLALGDALAVSLLERMGLTSEQYKVFHPGGKLGKRLMKVADVMQKFEDLPFADRDTPMSEAILTMTEKNLGCVIVMEDKGGMAGIITDGDLKRHMSRNLLEKRAGDIMSSNPKTIVPDALAVEALDIMTKTPGRYITSLMVVENGKLVGMIRLQDCLQAGIA